MCQDVRNHEVDTETYIKDVRVYVRSPVRVLSYCNTSKREWSFQTANEHLTPRKPCKGSQQNLHEFLQEHIE